MAGKICDVCGAENEPGAAFCVSCHSYLAWDETGLTVTDPRLVVRVRRAC
jgi:hypothetical protein